MRHGECHAPGVGYRVLSAFFYRREDAEEAMRQLVLLGVSAECISLLPGHPGHRDDLVVLARTRATEGAALGAMIGGVLGALLGALGVGGSVIAPVLGVVLAGPVVGALMLAAAMAVVAMSVGALIGALTPQYEARYVTDAVTFGGALMAVRCFDHGSAIERALAESGARRVHWEKTSC
jgi:hypothetical protein